MVANEAVGKKIVEALKKQSNQEIELIPTYDKLAENNEVNLNYENNNVSEVDTSNIDELYSETASFVNDKVDEMQVDSFAIEEPSVEDIDIKNEQNKVEDIISEMPKQPQGWNFGQQQEYSSSYINSQVNTINESGAKQYDLPPNVAVLKKLIAQLPSGVTRQTGAQIIKQTMEALGISMNTVLHEAQKVQDDMNSSIKNCMSTIQEYKNNIRNLEKQGLDYQRQVNQLNDLISLFILSENE